MAVTADVAMHAIDHADSTDCQCSLLATLGEPLLEAVKATGKFTGDVLCECCKCAFCCCYDSDDGCCCKGCCSGDCDGDSGAAGAAIDCSPDVKINCFVGC
uniref:Metallothionein n=1 Tax=Ditylenchus dipsaci TaxID=166011 RepID=A0A915DP38_9BILA